MPVETAADRDGFFRLDEFAEEGTYTPKGGGASYSVIVVMDRPDKSIDFGVAGGKVKSEKAKILASDIPPNEKKGGTLTVAGKSYLVRSIVADVTRRVLDLDLDPA